MDLEASRTQAQARFTGILLALSPLGRQAFLSGQMSIDACEGWQVTCDTYNNVLRWEYSPLRAYQEEQAKLVEQVRAQAAEEAHARPPIPRDVQMFVWQRDGGRCVQCGSQENLEFDHIIPFSMGGSSTARNIQLLCEPCNRAKSAQIG